MPRSESFATPHAPELVRPRTLLHSAARRSRDGGRVNHRQRPSWFAFRVCNTVFRALNCTSQGFNLGFWQCLWARGFRVLCRSVFPIVVLPLLLTCRCRSRAASAHWRLARRCSQCRPPGPCCMRSQFGLAVHVCPTAAVGVLFSRVLLFSSFSGHLSLDLHAACCCSTC